MPTTKPRLAITLEPHRHELLRRLARLQGVSASFLVADLVETVAPVLERVCVTLENAQAASASVKENLRRVALEAEAAMQPHAQAVMGQLDMFLLQSVQAAEPTGKKATGAKRARPAHGSRRAPDALETPRPVITGGRYGTPGPTKTPPKPVTARHSKKSGVGG